MQQQQHWVTLVCFSLSTLFLLCDPVLLPLGLFSALALGVNQFLFNRWPFPQPSMSWLHEVVFLIVVPALEEQVFRWWLPSFLLQLNWSLVQIPFFTAISFSLWHILSFNRLKVNWVMWLQVINSFLLGWLLPLWNLPKSVAMHVFFNAVILLGMYRFEAKSTTRETIPRLFLSTRRRSHIHFRTSKDRAQWHPYTIPESLRDSSARLDSFIQTHNIVRD